MLITSMFHLALRDLFSNLGRSLLTMLGIIIGVTSVILIISVGAGAQSLIFNQIEGAGSNLIGILPGGQEEDEQGPPAAAYGAIITTLTYEDALAISDQANVPHAIAVTPFVRGSVLATFGNITIDSIVTGVSSEFLTLIDGRVVEGQFFSANDEASLARVAMLGSQVRDDLFDPEENPIGQFIRMNKVNFRIIGVLEPRGTRGLENQDEQIYIPVSTAQKILLGQNYVGLIRVKVDTPENIPQTMEDITVLLRTRHRIQEVGKEDFFIENQIDALEVLGGITDALRFFLASIAAISLLVGGVGIMNIMLVSVSERTREIGLRKAIGAPRRSIQRQFLIESATLSLTGGVIGILLGASLSFLTSLIANGLGYNWDFVITLNSVVLAVSVSVSIGIIFGYYPARHAASIDPIQALRYE